MLSTVVGNSLRMAASSVGGAPTENKQEKKSNDRHLKYRRLAACGCNFMAGVLLKGGSVGGRRRRLPWWVVGAIAFVFVCELFVHAIAL